VFALVAADVRGFCILMGSIPVCFTSKIPLPFAGAADRNRTGTDFTPRDFKLSEDNALCTRIKAYKNPNFSAQSRKLFRCRRKMFKIRKNRHALKNPNLAVFFAQRR